VHHRFGVQQRMPQTALYVFAVATAVISCGRDVVEPSAAAQGSLPATATSLSANGISPIEFVTYDGSNQVTHPAAVVFDSAWHGHRYWLALTPYPNSDSRFENPSLYAGETGSDWAPPSGVTNPLARTGRGYLSDPELMYDPDGDALRLYFREVVTTSDKHHRTQHVADNVLLTSSNDGVHWSAAQVVATDRSHYVVSPSIARTGAGDWRMWEVDAGTKGCVAQSTRVVARQSTDGTSWSGATAVQLAQPGYSAWHLDVQYLATRGEYWALVAAFPHGQDCTNTSLFLATSRDGVTWTTYKAPMLARGRVAQFATNVYRSSFRVDETSGAVTIWLTGAETVTPRSRKFDAVLRWSAGLMQTTTTELLARVTTAPNRALPADSEPEIVHRLAQGNIVP